MNETLKKSDSDKSLNRSPSKVPLVAKKSFVICHNQYLREIREGDDLSDVPAIYHPNLITEGVI